jgi:membrane protein DedA with SNARE-associated domain
MFDWISRYLSEGGYVAVALLMFAENLFPPIPSELIMPLAGFTAAQGELDIVLAVTAGAIGSLLGALFWYYLGLWVGSERLRTWAARHGRWVTFGPEDIDYVCAWFNRHGGKAVFVGRLVPAVRTLISLPAGFAQMSLRRFLIASALGTLLWTALLALAGYLLESQYWKVAEWMNPIADAVIAMLVLWYLYRVATFRRDPPPSA